MNHEMTLINLTTEQFIQLVDLCAFKSISKAKTNLSKIELLTNYLPESKQILWELHLAHRDNPESSLFEGWFEFERGFRVCVTISTLKKNKVIHTQGGWLPIEDIYRYLKDAGYYDKHDALPAINPQLSCEVDTILLDEDYSINSTLEKTA